MVIALPAHTSHALQPLDLSVFASTKEKFRQLLSERTISTRRDLKNDMFLIAEMVTKSYDHSLSMENIKSGFKKSGIWPLDVEIALQRRDLRNVEGTENGLNTTSTEDNSDAHTRQSFLSRHKELLNAFRHRHGVWDSDGLLPGTAHVTTASGATITSDNILAALRAQEEEKDSQKRLRKSQQRRKENAKKYTPKLTRRYSTL